MSKMHIYGDSFADPEFNTQGHDWAWTKQIAQRYSVTNHAQAGTGCDWSLQKLLATDLRPIDSVVFVCGYANRYHLMPKKDLQNCTPIFTESWLQRQYISTVATVKAVCPRAIVFLVDQNTVQHHIYDGYSFRVHPTPLLDIYERDNLTYRSDDWPDQGNRDRRPNHLQQANHEYILKTIEDFVCK